jgi:septal ring factor EnvC (AmiA/AmiB activator)
VISDSRSLTPVWYPLNAACSPQETDRIPSAISGFSPREWSYTARRTPKRIQENRMSAVSLQEPEVVVDDFVALEERVLRAIELVKSERAARSEAEQRASRLQSELEAQNIQLEQTQEQVRTLERDREQVRQRVEKLLKQLDEISS